MPASVFMFMFVAVFVFVLVSAVMAPMTVAGAMADAVE